MANHTRPASRLRAAALLLLSGSLIAMACEAPAPAALAPEEDEAVDAVPGPSATVSEFRAIELPDGPRTDGEAPPPIIIVDGVIVASFPFSRLDPGDIERVEVIKGEAALRLYGERAAGGVVQITTKAGADEAGTVERRVQPQDPVAAGPDGGTVTRLVERPRPVLVSARKPAPPLIYVDGEAFDGTLEDVNRMSVASVEVLDAAAAASYGPAGANGVVIVTTR